MKYAIPFVFLALFFITTANSLQAARMHSRDISNNPTVTVTGTVKNNLKVPIDSAEVQAIDSSGATVASTLTNNSGAYSLSVAPGTYNIKAIPPVSSGFTPAILLVQTISMPTIINFVLVPSGICNLSGQITDRDGTPVAQQLVKLTSFADFYDTTDATGNYSFTVTSGTYTFTIPSQPGIVPPNFPQNFFLSATDISLSISTVLNIQIPNVALTVTVLDLTNSPIPGTTIATELAMTSTTFNAGSVVFHGNIGATGVTDTAGKVVLWMLPTTTYLKVTPPVSSGCVAMRLDSVSIHADTALTIHLVTAVTLNGQITDRDGTPVAQQLVKLTNFTDFYDTTDATGNYSFTVTPGTYTFTIPSQPGIVPPHFPQNFFLSATDISLSISTVLNIQIPNVALTVTVLEPANNPVPGTTIATELAMTSTTFNAGSVVFHGNIGATGVTDTAGKVVLWMLPTTTYLKVTPPSGSGFLAFKVDSVIVISDMSLVIHLESLTGVRNGTIMTTEFILHQNFPNPFNPVTTIQYDIPTMQPSEGRNTSPGTFGRFNVSLRVYDILGKEVATLVNETKEAGSYEVKFNASQLASGIYFYRIHAGNFVSVKKLLLMK